MAAPDVFYTIRPASATSTATLDNNRYDSLDDAQRAALRASLSSAGEIFVVMTSTHYTDTPLTDTAIEPLVPEIP